MLKIKDTISKHKSFNNNNIGTKLGDRNDLERRNGGYFPLFHRNW